MADELAELGGAGKPVAGGKKDRDRRLAYITIGVGAIGTLVAYLAYRRQASAAAATSTSSPGAYSYPTTTGTGTIGVAPSAAYGQDPATASYDQALLQGISGIQSELSGLGSPSTGTVSTSSPPGSYGNPTYGPTSGGTYQPITGGYQGVAADAAAGLPIYYQPSAGGPWVEIPEQDIYPGSGYSNTAIFVPGGSSTGPPLLQPAQPASGAMVGGPGITVSPGGKGGAGNETSKRASAPVGANVGAVGRFMPDGQLTMGEQFVTRAFGR